MNTASNENTFEDLTTLVARDGGANEPDMSTNDLSYVDVQDLFVTYHDNGTRGPEEAIVEDVAIVSPLDALKEIILALDWDVSSSNLKKCQAEIEGLLKGCQDDQYSVALLKMLSTIVKYLDVEKVNAHPDSVKVLTSAYVCLEKIASSSGMDDADKNQALAQEVAKFKTLRQKIAKNIKGPKATGGEDRGSREIDALTPLKAMVLSIDWGEISQERIDAFFAEIAALKKRWQADGTLVQGLEILRAYGHYIFVKKDHAHPDSFSQFFASYNSLERVLASDHLTPADKKEIISLELQKFITLKKQITSGQEPSIETTASPAFAPGEEGTRQLAEGGQAALFMNALDSRLDDFFAEKDATQAAALQVAELPGDESTSSYAEGAPAAMSDDVVPSMAGGDKGPALFIEEAHAPEQVVGGSAVQEEVLIHTVEGTPALPMAEDIPLPLAGSEEGPALFMEEANAPEEDRGVSAVQDETLIHADEGSPAQSADDTVPLSSTPEKVAAEDFMPEVPPQAEKPDRSVTSSTAISVAEEVGQKEQSEILVEPDLAITYDQGLESDRAAHEAPVAEELFAAATVSEQEDLAVPALSCPSWFAGLAPLIAGLQGQCSDAAVAALRREIATVSTRRALPPAACIALDLLSAVAAQLAALAEGDRAEGAALLKSMRLRLTTGGGGNETGTDASAVPTIQSLVHDYAAWQSKAIRLVTSRYPTDRPCTQAAPAAAEPQAAKAPALAEEALSGAASTPSPRQDQTAATGSFFEKIRQLFKK